MELVPAVVGLIARSICSGCGTGGATLCPLCEATLLPAPPLPSVEGASSAIAAWQYAGLARTLILDLKLSGRRAAAQPMTAALARAIQREGTPAEVVTWVPGRRRETRARGYNHAELLGRGVAEALGLDARPLLRRRGCRPDQAGLSGADRHRNTEGAFGARPSVGAILLIDDLVTTGATARACTLALRRAGAEVVEVAAVCCA
jgi:ComF family protein